MPRGSSRIRTADQVGTEHDCTFPWAFLCFLGSSCVSGCSGLLSVPPLHPDCPLEGIPSPGAHFGAIPTPWLVPCLGPSSAFVCTWLCLFGLPTALKEPFRVHRTSPWDFLCHRGLWPPLHIPVCVNIAWESLVHSQPSGCALDYPRAPLEPLATTDPREGIRNTPMEA